MKLLISPKVGETRKIIVMVFQNGVSKTIVHVINHANYQLHRAYSYGVIWKN